jgi:hypothetical protein
MNAFDANVFFQIFFLHYLAATKVPLSYSLFRLIFKRSASRGECERNTERKSLLASKCCRKFESSQCTTVYLCV